VAVPSSITGDPRDQIALLEDRIETLTESIERCGKFALAAKILVMAGAVWFALVLLSFIAFDPTLFVAAMAAILGGIVLAGSNATTRAQAETELKTAEAMRTGLIERLELPEVNAGTRTLH
jgi:hypothetical protein